jgi:His-Xaa-Ser system radical SAM maturase HxsC
MTTLIDLAGRLKPLSQCSAEPIVARVTEDRAGPVQQRSSSALLVKEGPEQLPPGFAAYLLHANDRPAIPSNTFLLPMELRYLADGDVVRIDAQTRRLHTIYRKGSRSNSFLVTERCDNYCVMCSQPPKEREDSWLVDELLRVLPLVDQETEAVGITGGEPGLLGDRLVELLTAFKQHLPKTTVHVLSNGRAFANATFARAIAGVGLADVMIGVPLYSDLAEEHDYVVQSRGAFDETIRGVLNLKRARVKVELRFVIHRDTVQRMPHWAEFVTRNLLFVDHVALMGLELMGFAKANLDALWVDPLDYGHELEAAVRVLDRARIPLSIYNHQLCVLPRGLHSFARQSISDWKNWYAPECESCDLRDSCGGFFASSRLRRSRGVAAISSGEYSQ